MNKRLLAATKYQIWEGRTSIATFYLILAAIFCVNFVVAFVAADNDGGAYGSYDGISLIFLFVAGIATFGTELRLYLQCGLNRKQLTVSLLLSLLAMSLIMTVGDFLFNLVINLLAPAIYGNITPMLTKLLYPEANLFVRMLVHFCALTMFSYLGLLIAAIFFQIPKKFRWLYCAGLPIGTVALGGKLFTVLGADKTVSLFLTLFGTPLHAIGVFAGVTAVALLISHLLTMRSYLR